ncbi:MAG TPA: ABC transporter permease, partial [Pirellulales bacterium]|nr:ABC transporter permease [Pirellulales bacterium]
MTVLDRKLLRELRASWGLLLATTSLIAVGVMCFIYMRTAHRNLRLAQAQYYVEGRLADFWIDLKKLPLSEIDLLKSIPGINEVRPRIQFFATVDLPRVREPMNGQVLSVPDHWQPMINDLVLRRGSYFTDSRRNEVIVNDAFAREHKLYPGQVVHLILNNQRQELFIVGTAISPEFVYLVGPGSLTPDPHHFGVFYLKQSFAEEVFDMEGAANQLVGTVSPEFRENPAPLLRQAETALAPYGVFNTLARKDQPSSRYLSDEIRGLGVFASIMPTIFLVVAALVLNVLMSRLVDQQQTIIGTLKGLGYADSQIFMHYVKFAGAIGILGAAVGCLGGYGMSEFVTRLYRTFFEFPELANRFEPSLYVLGIVISLACSLGGALHGARLALKLQPAEAMHVKPPPQGKAVWLERIAFLWRR